MSFEPSIPRAHWDQVPPAAQTALAAAFQQYQQRSAALERRVRDLEERLGQNSTNSSKPPVHRWPGRPAAPALAARATGPGREARPPAPHPPAAAPRPRRPAAADRLPALRARPPRQRPGALGAPGARTAAP